MRGQYVAVRIGLLHPGRLGAGLGAALVASGRDVRWASEGRSPATSARAGLAGLVDAGTLDRLVDSCDLIVSVCPAAAAPAVAAAAARARRRRDPWTFLDANPLTPDAVAEVARVVIACGGCFVDGRLVGPPPAHPGTTRLYLSGPDALAVSDQMASPLVELHVLGEQPGAASAVDG